MLIVMSSFLLVYIFFFSNFRILNQIYIHLSITGILDFPHSKKNGHCSKHICLTFSDYYLHNYSYVKFSACIHFFFSSCRIVNQILLSLKFLFFLIPRTVISVASISVSDIFRLFNSHRSNNLTWKIYWRILRVEFGNLIAICLYFVYLRI